MSGWGQSEEERTATPGPGADDDATEWFADGGVAARRNIRSADDSRHNFVAAPDELQLRDLLARVVDRDQEALAALYEALVGRVYGLALRVTGRPQTAEEVVQDTFWQVWRQAPRFDPSRGSALAWVMMMARTRALDALRRVTPDECELEPEMLATIASSGKDAPPDLLNAVQEGHYLHAALARLDPVPRQLLSLAFLRGHSHEEIAEQAGLPLGTVKSHIRRALAALRKTLPPDIGLTL